MTSQSIYLASRYSRREELVRYREQLRALCYQVTSRWLNGNHQISDAGLADEHGDQGFATAERERFATEDLADLTDADTIIAFTEAPRSASTRGGRHVEVGIAIGQGKRVLIVGHRENVFCCLPIVEFFPTWEAALQQLQIERAVRDAMVARGLAEHNEQMLRDLRDQVRRIGTLQDIGRPDHPVWRGVPRSVSFAVNGAAEIEPRPPAATAVSSMPHRVEHVPEIARWEADGGRLMPEGGSDAR